MRNEWRPIEGFEQYQIDHYGNVRGRRTGRPLTWSFARDIPTVTMMVEGRQYRRTVPLLVAKAWLPPPERYDFITPIHLDSDRCNCYFQNLMWRPRWFAVAYNREREENPFPNWRKPLELIETREIFETPRSCSYVYGVLERAVWKSIHQAEPIFPYGFNARTIS
jgi:hypothetical protein